MRARQDDAVEAAALIALRFLQTSQAEFRLVTSRASSHLHHTRYRSRQVFAGRGYLQEFPGLAPGKRVYGPLRLLDVKPPCSNLAGTSCSGHFSLFYYDYYSGVSSCRPVTVGSRQGRGSIVGCAQFEAAGRRPRRTSGSGEIPSGSARGTTSRDGGSIRRRQPIPRRGRR